MESEDVCPRVHQDGMQILFSIGVSSVTVLVKHAQTIDHNVNLAKDSLF